MGAILSLSAREILDSRAMPTVEAEVVLEDGTKARACVPSGASTGRYEAHEKRDEDQNRYGGRGVLQAVRNVRGEIAATLRGMDACDQRHIDRTLIALDGTDNKARLGANAILSVSLAVARAAAQSKALPLYRYMGGVNAHRLPTPMMNILNGGAHANNGLDIQEFMIMPMRNTKCSPSSDTPNFNDGLNNNHDDDFANALRMGVEVFHALKALLEKKGLSTGAGDEGGFAPAVKSHAHALEMLCTAIENAGYTPMQDIAIALDAAASQFYTKDGLYHLAQEGKTLNREELVDWYRSLIDQFPIVSIEDAMEEDDEKGWTHLSAVLADKIQLVGDDLFVTDVRRLRDGIANGIANAILIKPNQIGTLSETIDAVTMAQSHRYGAIISHRSGETEDDFIADLAVSTGCGQIKTGAPARSERTAKYNRLLMIAEQLSLNGVYAGHGAISGMKPGH